MKNQCYRILSTLGILLASASGVQAACPPSTLRPLVLVGARTAYLLKSDLGLSVGSLQWTPATHGLVIDGGDRLVYTPNSTFWDLGIDSIVVSTPGRNDLPKAVQWVAGTRHGETSMEDFEDPQNPNWDLGSFDPAAISPLGKLSGNLGLRFTTASSGGAANASIPWTGETNGATAGGGAIANWHPPGGGGGGSNGTCGAVGQDCPSGLWYRFLRADGNHDGMTEHSVYVKEDGALVRVGLSPGDSLPSGTDPIAVATVTREAHTLELLHWPTVESRTAGAALWIDGRYALEIETPGESLVATPSLPPTFTFETVPATVASGGTNLAHSFDNLAVFSVPDQARFDCLALDGFDNGALDPAWATINGGNLSVHSGATLAGRMGLDVHLADLGASSGGLLKLTGFQGQSRHGLKLRFDPNTPEFGPGGTFNLVVGLQSESTPRPFLALLKRNAAGALVVQIQSRDDLGGARSTPIVISDAPHVLEVDWQRSLTTHAPTGYLRAWIDGVLVAEQLNVDNDAMSVNEIRIGALGALGAVKGHVFLDQIEAWADALPWI